MKSLQRINRSTLSVFAISLLATPLMQACGGDVDRPPMSVPGAETPSARLHQRSDQQTDCEHRRSGAIDSLQ